MTLLLLPGQLQTTDDQWACPAPWLHPASLLLHPAGHQESTWSKAASPRDSHPAPQWLLPCRCAMDKNSMVARLELVLLDCGNAAVHGNFQRCSTTGCPKHAKPDPLVSLLTRHPLSHGCETYLISGRVSGSLPAVTSQTSTIVTSEADREPLHSQGYLHHY